MSEHPNTAKVYDNALRFMVESRTTPGKEYLVDLGAYNGQGRCVCRDFEIHFEPYLRRGFTPEQVWAAGKIKKLRPYQFGPRDCLSCFHLIDGRAAAAWSFIRAMVKADAVQRAGR